MDGDKEQNRTENEQKPFQWNKIKERAAILLAEDELTDEEIAKAIGKGRTALSEWKSHPTFAARVAANVKAYGNAALKRAIAKRSRRVQWLDERAELMRRVIEERAADPLLAQVPGGPTGVMVRKLKGIGKGENFQIVEEFEVDTGLLREMREHEKQAAQELNQFKEVHEIRGAGGGALKQHIVVYTPEQAAQADRELEDWNRGDNGDSVQSRGSGDVLPGTPEVP